MESVETLSRAVVKARTLCLQHSVDPLIYGPWNFIIKRGAIHLPWGVSELLGATAL